MAGYAREHGDVRKVFYGCVFTSSLCGVDELDRPFLYWCGSSNPLTANILDLEHIDIHKRYIETGSSSFVSFGKALAYVPQRSCFLLLGRASGLPDTGTKLSLLVAVLLPIAIGSDTPLTIVAEICELVIISLWGAPIVVSACLLLPFGLLAGSMLTSPNQVVGTWSVSSTTRSPAASSAVASCLQSAHAAWSRLFSVHSPNSRRRTEGSESPHRRHG